MTEQNAASAKKSRRKIGCIVLLVLLAIVIAGAFKVKLIKIPKCHPAIQETVDWPPEEYGVYERESSNRLRALDAAPRLPITPPGRVELCNVPDADAADTVALVPAQPQLVVFMEDVSAYEIHLFHSVDLPDTGECARALAANEVEGIAVAVDEENDKMVWIAPPDALDPEQTYMLTVGVEAPTTCNTGNEQECWGVILRVGGAEE